MKSTLPFEMMAFSTPVSLADSAADQYASGDSLHRKDMAWQRRKTTVIAASCGILFGLGMIGGEVAVLYLAR